MLLHQILMNLVRLSSVKKAMACIGKKNVFYGNFSYKFTINCNKIKILYCLWLLLINQLYNLLVFIFGY